MTKLLLDEQPLVILPKLATAIGLNEAIVLQQIHYWIELYKKANDDRHFVDGKWWVWNTGKEWQENFPFWSESTVWRTLDKLRKPTDTRGPLVIADNHNKKGYDQTKWYTIDYEEVDRIEASYSGCETPVSQNDEMELVNLEKPIPETTRDYQKELGADAPESSDSDLTDERKPVTINLVDNEYLYEDCPECGGRILLRELSKTSAECPHCKVPIWLRDIDGIAVRKPAQQYRSTKKKRVLGNVIECPEQFRHLPPVGVKSTTLKTLYGQNKDMLYECLQWALGKVAEGKMPEHKAVQSAVSWMQKRLSAAEAQYTEQPKEKKGPIVIDMERAGVNLD